MFKFHISFNLEYSVVVLEWPRESPDLNPMEMLWKDLKRTVHVRKPTNIPELNLFCTEKWAKLERSRNVWLRLSLYKEVTAETQGKGPHTDMSYWTISLNK